MNITYPKKAREFTGKVIVGFVVEKDGSIRNENIKIEQGIHDLLDKVAIRLVKSMPKWTPAYLGVSL
jgi:periplasmic protein TonB